MSSSKKFIVIGIKRGRVNRFGRTICEQEEETKLKAKGTKSGGMLPQSKLKSPILGIFIDLRFRTFFEAHFSITDLHNRYLKAVSPSFVVLKFIEAHALKQKFLWMNHLKICLFSSKRVYEDIRKISERYFLELSCLVVLF